MSLMQVIRMMDDDETDSEQKDSQPALESAGDKDDRFDVDVPMSNQ